MPAIPEESRNKLKVTTAAMNKHEKQAFLVLSSHPHGLVTIMTGKELSLNGAGLSSEEVNCNRIKAGQGGAAIFSSSPSTVFLSEIS